MELKTYQQEKIERLKDEINELLNLPDNRIVILLKILNLFNNNCIQVV